MTSVPFVGVGHHELVGRLVEAYTRVSADRRPEWWSLEANTGWGKTRVIQEAYARIAAGQGEDAYWPATLLDPEAEGDVAALRKRVHPEHVRPPHGVTPEWFWWGISCSTRHGTPLAALRQDLGRFEPHEEALRQRFRELSSRWERSKGWAMERRGEAGEAVVGDALSTAAAAAGLAVPGLGLLVLAGKWGLEVGQDWLRDRREEPDAGPRRRDLVGEIAPWLERFAFAGIPLVIVVEDLHDADEALVELVARVLAAEHAPILVVTTCWRGLLDQPEREAHRLLDRVPADRTHRVQCERDLAALDTTDLDAIASALLPPVDGASLARLTARYPNPFALQLACRTRPVARAAAAGGVPEGVLARLPREVDDLFRELWDELPEAIRRVLMAASRLTPAAVSADLGVGDLRWDAELVAEAVAAVQSLADEMPEIQPLLQAGAAEFSWVREIEDWLQRFNDGIQSAVAYDASERELAVEEHNALVAAVPIDAVVDQDSALRREHRDRLLVALAGEGHAAWDNVTRGAALRSARALAETGATTDLTLAVRICTLAADGARANDGLGLALRTFGATCTGELGRADAAVAQLRPLLDDGIGAFGAEAPETLETRAVLALWEGRAGQLEAAIERSRGVLDDQIKLLGDDHPQTLTTRNNLAAWLAASGRVQAGIAELTLIVDQRTKMLGADAPSTLVSRGTLATWLGESGRVAAAVEAYGRLVDDGCRVLGADAPDTLKMRNNLAYWLEADGQVLAAYEQYDRLLEDETRVLGPDAPETLKTRSNLATALAAAGLIELAVEQFRQLLQDSTRVFGADAGETLTMRNNLACTLGSDGRLEEAIALLESLDGDFTRTLGPDAPDTLRVRNNLAHYLASDGRLEEGIEQFGRLLGHSRRVLGPEAPDTLRARNNLADWLRRDGQVEAAIEEFSTLLDEQLRVLADDHPHVAYTRDALTELRARQGSEGDGAG